MRGGLEQESGSESREHTSRDSEGKVKRAGGERERERGTEVVQRLCDVPRTLLSDPGGLRKVDGCCVRRATETLSWFVLELIS